MPGAGAASNERGQRPARILHGAGNFRELLPLGDRREVDGIEADVWVRSGLLVAHHNRPLGPLPVTIGARGLGRGPLDPVNFEDLLDAVAGRAELVLDLRSWFGDPAPDVVRALLAVSDRSHIGVSCESWDIADRIRAWLPDQHVIYSVRSERQLRRYIADRMAEARPSVTVTVRHTLLHGPTAVDSLRARAGRVGAWTVDDPERARLLASWGVDFIVSNRIEVLAAI